MKASPRKVTKLILAMRAAGGPKEMGASDWLTVSRRSRPSGTALTKAFLAIVGREPTHQALGIALKEHLGSTADEFTLTGRHVTSAKAWRFRIEAPGDELAAQMEATAEQVAKAAARNAYNETKRDALRRLRGKPESKKAESVAVVTGEPRRVGRPVVQIAEQSPAGTHETLDGVPVIRPDTERRRAAIQQASAAADSKRRDEVAAQLRAMNPFIPDFVIDFELTRLQWIEELRGAPLPPGASLNPADHIDYSSCAAIRALDATITKAAPGFAAWNPFTCFNRR